MRKRLRRNWLRRCKVREPLVDTGRVKDNLQLRLEESILDPKEPEQEGT